MAGRGRPRVAVVGAGWAGISAAWRLARAGYSVVLIEERREGGGRAFSFLDRESGLVLDNGQHVLLGCCRRFPALLDELGVEDALRFQPHLTVPVYREGERAEVRATALPGPLALLPLLRYRHLGPGGREALLPLLLRLTFGHPRGQETFAAWLGRRADDPLLASLLEPILVAVLNRHAAEVDAGTALGALRRGFLAGAAASRLGFFRRPLGDLAQEAVQALRRAGVDVMLGRAALALELDEGRIVALRLRGSEPLPVDGAVVALPPAALLRLLPQGMRRDPFFLPLQAARTSPIVNVYLRYDEPILREEVAALLTEHAPVLLNRGRLLGQAEEDGRLIAISVSAADRLLGVAPRDLVPYLLAEVARAMPAFTRANPRFVRVVWQRQATIALDPEGAGLRRPQGTPLANLWLAGDWTDTGWPPSLESAVVSGERAAALVLTHLPISPARGRAVPIRSHRPARLDPGARLATDQARTVR
jgi:squalene-associated FAD-dependent desaturase